MGRISEIAADLDKLRPDDQPHREQAAAQAQHTPGPWEMSDTTFNDGDGVQGYTEIVVDDGLGGKMSVATVYGTAGAEWSDRRCYDARLIAAAPDMLATLEAARIVLKSRDQDQREAKLLLAIRIVIAKATGAQS